MFLLNARFEFTENYFDKTEVNDDSIIKQISWKNET